MHSDKHKIKCSLYDRWGALLVHWVHSYLMEASGIIDICKTSHNVSHIWWFSNIWSIMLYFCIGISLLFPVVFKLYKLQSLHLCIQISYMYKNNKLYSDIHIHKYFSVFHPYRQVPILNQFSASHMPFTCKNIPLSN